MTAVQGNAVGSCVTVIIINVGKKYMYTTSAMSASNVGPFLIASLQATHPTWPRNAAGPLPLPQHTDPVRL